MVNKYQQYIGKYRHTGPIDEGGAAYFSIGTHFVEFHDSKGFLHYDGGPARIYNPDKYKISGEDWVCHGKCHRIDGPAKIWGTATEWWINGYCVTYKMTQWAKEQNIDLDTLTDEDKVLIKLTWDDYGRYV